MEQSAVEPAAVEASPRGSRWGAPRCGYYSNAFMLWVGRRFLWLAYFFAWFVAAYFLLAAPRARRASMSYLDRIYGPRGLLRRAWQTYRHMVVFSYLLLDRAVMLADQAHGFAVTCDGLEHLAEAAADHPGQDHGIILLTAHFGNAEIAAPYLKLMGISRPIHIVMYQDARDPTEQFHTRHRHLLADMTIISTTDPLAAGTRIIAALRAGHIVGMRADRTLAGKGVPSTLLGESVLLPAGPFVTAALSGAPVVHVYTCRQGYRRYACLLSPARRYGEDQAGTRAERIAQAASDFAGGLETVLRRHPYQWANFFDLWTAQRPELTR